MKNRLSVAGLCGHFSQSLIHQTAIDHLHCAGQGMEDPTENIPDFGGPSMPEGAVTVQTKSKTRLQAVASEKTSWVGWQMSSLTVQSAGT